MPDWMLGLAPSDYLILASALVLVWFMIDYGIFTPWWRFRENGFIGLAILLASGSTMGLIFLIGWGVVFGQRVGEPVRVLVTAGLFAGIVLKIIILHHERKVGHLARRFDAEHPSHHQQKEKQ